MTFRPDDLNLERHQLGRSDRKDSGSTPPKGLNGKVIRELSQSKGEPDWMLAMRLKSFNHFENRAMPTWGGDLSEIHFDNICYYNNSIEPRGLPETEPTERANGTEQDEAAAVFRRNSNDLTRQGVVFCEMETALREFPELVQPYFGQIVSMDDNKFSALNSSVWSGGSFIYVPPGVEVDMPLQAYFRIDGEKMGQFERTLIVADEGSKVRYIEGCSSPVYTADALHAAVVEVVVKKHAQVTYTTIQNWSSNVFNLVTKRAVVEAEGRMEWIDGNIGSRLTMQYPSVWLLGPQAAGEVLSVAYAGNGQHQDTGAKMVHAAPETTSSVISKSISKGGGRSSFRGLVRVENDAYGCKSHVQRDCLLLDEESIIETHPFQEIGAADAQIEYDSTISKIADEQLFYLMSRGLTQQQAIGLVMNGFIEPVARTLPIEYSVELSRLIELQMEGSVG